MLVVAQQLRKWFADPVDSLFIQVPRALLASMLAAVVDCAILFFLVNHRGDASDALPALGRQTHKGNINE